MAGGRVGGRNMVYKAVKGWSTRVLLSAKKEDVFLSVVVRRIKDGHILLNPLPTKRWLLCPFP